MEIAEVTSAFAPNIAAFIELVWRAGLKGSAIEDLKKARWYLDREIARLSGMDPDKIKEPK